jgi:hypothetical protein
MKIDPERRPDLLAYAEDVRFAQGRLYQLRMAVGYDELPSPSRTALRISRLESQLGRLADDLRKAWSE